MKGKEIIIGEKKNIALVVHDNKKRNLLEWVRFNKNTLQKHKLFATGSTGKLLEDELNSKITIFESDHWEEINKSVLELAKEKMTF